MQVLEGIAALLSVPAMQTNLQPFRWMIKCLAGSLSQSALNTTLSSGTNITHAYPG